MTAVKHVDTLIAIHTPADTFAALLTGGRW